MATLHPYSTFTYGTDNVFTPNDGDTASGGQTPGQKIGKFTCAPQMYDAATNYHVHPFLGILYNGSRIAVPDAIGMPGAGPENPSGWTGTAKCYFGVHTHDSSGYIHIESNLLTSKQRSDELATLGDLLNIWGQALTATRFGPFNGTVRVFYANTELGDLITGNATPYQGHPAHPYLQWTSTFSSLPLYSHEAIWIEVGSTYVPASRLPAVVFDIQY